MDLAKLLGKNVKYYRFQKKLTQEQLAEKLNASSNYIGRIERGQHSPSLKKIAHISKVLDVEPYELFINRSDKKTLPSRVNLIKNKK
ncbi:MAG: helix-turn-helix transcriptional regulator [Clostridia bacterium]|nr:helix-turn-helix transcriptional regulator [Clostridia bacterium]